MVYPLGERFSRNAGDRRLAGGVDIEHLERIGIVKGGDKIIHQVARAGETMRLEDDVDSLVSALPRGGGPVADLFVEKPSLWWRAFFCIIREFRRGSHLRF